MVACTQLLPLPTAPHEKQGALGPCDNPLEYSLELTGSSLQWADPMQNCRFQSLETSCALVSGNARRKRGGEPWLKLQFTNTEPFCVCPHLNRAHGCSPRTRLSAGWECRERAPRAPLGKTKCILSRQPAIAQVGGEITCGVVCNSYLPSTRHREQTGPLDFTESE